MLFGVNCVNDFPGRNKQLQYNSVLREVVFVSLSKDLDTYSSEQSINVIIATWSL